MCTSTGKTAVEMSHGGSAARPLLLAQPLEAAVCTMGARNGRLNTNLEMRIRAEAGSTLLIDSTQPVKLLPSADGNEFGIGIHAGVESEALLVITPDAHVPHQDAHTGLWTRYDLSPSASLVSVQLADLKEQAKRAPASGGRYTSRTRVHHITRAHTASSADFTLSGWSATETLPYINESCAREAVSSCGLKFDAKPSWTCDWTYGRRFQGLVMGTPSTNVIASVVLAGPRAESVIHNFQSIDAVEETHYGLGLLGQAHLATQHVWLAAGELTVVRVATEYREDMHRLLSHALQPLEEELGTVPYDRLVRANSTANVAHSSFMPPLFETRAGSDTKSQVRLAVPVKERRIHVQHSSVEDLQVHA